MIERILDFSSEPARLSVRLKQLQIERREQPRRSVPVNEIAVLLAAHPQLKCTQAVLSELAQAGGTLVVCDQRSLPVGMMMPLVQHCLQTQRIAAQASTPRRLRGRLWRQIVRAKIRSQGACLWVLWGKDFGLGELSRKVRSGDPSNLEAQAARRYWKHLFGTEPFRRDPDKRDANLMLNYGYAVVRAIVARAICASGLHPSLGLHHHNRSNPYCLADDLMEPFRPIVDRAVVEYSQGQTCPEELTPQVKTYLVERITGRLRIAGKLVTVFDAASQLSASLAEVYLTRKGRLQLPDWHRSYATQ